MINIYNEINALEATLRKTPEFEALKEAVAAVKEDQEALNLFKNFRKVQIDLQQKQLTGQDILEDELVYAQKQHSLHSKMQKFLQCLRRK